MGKLLATVPALDLVVPREPSKQNIFFETFQDRFTTIMKERVDALNKVEDLEHINLQLQNECDTIGTRSLLLYCLFSCQR